MPNPSYQRAVGNLRKPNSMGDEYTMLYLRPSQQENFGAHLSPPIFNNQIRGLELFKREGNFNSVHQVSRNMVETGQNNQTNVKGGNFIQGTTSNMDHMKNQTQSNAINSLVASFSLNSKEKAKPVVLMEAARKSPSISQEDNTLSDQSSFNDHSEGFVKMCSGFGHQECFSGQDGFSDIDIFQTGNSEEDISVETEALLTTPPKVTYGVMKERESYAGIKRKVETVKMSLKWDLLSTAMEAADTEEGEKNIMEEMMEVEEMIGVNGMDVKADRLQEMEVMVDMKKEEEGRFRLVGPFS